MKDVKAIFLDIDNTLLSFDEYVKHSMEEGFAHFGLKKYDPGMYETFTKVNNTLWQRIESGTLSFSELEKIRWNQVFQALDISFDGVVFEKYFRDSLYESAIPEKGAYELLNYLQGKVIICAASNGPYDQQVHRLEIADMKKYFDYIFVSEKLGASKPSAVFFDRAFEEMNRGRKDIIMPEECIMLGDSVTSDIEGGRRYGMKTCLYRKNNKVSVPENVIVVDTLKEFVDMQMQEADYKITMEQAETEMVCYSKVFDKVQLLGEEALDALKKEKDSGFENCGSEQGHHIYQCMGCAALDAFYEKEEISKLEFIGDGIYQIMAKYLEIAGKPYVMELLKSMDRNSMIAPGDRERLIRSLSGYNERLYSDVLTKVYNRRYFEEELKNQKGPAGIAMIDLDDFKLYNDTYGHKAGDMALTTVAQVIYKYICKTDILVRYGGDEFLLILPNVKALEFTQKLQEILDRIYEATVPGYARIQLSVSIGGTIADADETIESVVGRADRFMYQAKTRKNLVVTESSEIREGGSTEDKHNELKQQILIVDDSELNREILAEILHPDFKTMEARSGEEGLSLLRQYGAGISLVLLDIVMPGMDGFAVLEEMNRNHWLEDIPVIMISSEETESYIRRAYEMGVSDYISRPFDARVVYRRVYNTIKLYVKQRRLITLVTDQIQEKEKNSQILVDILSHIVEFRNGESGLHVQHIKTLTELLLERLVQKTDQYHLQWSDQYMITVASALHDIGKVGIDEKILNKPGRLTKEEFEEMKKHTLIGASMLKSLGVYQDEELVKVAYQICRWHHERYDGKGYPDGLKGEEIPISAQVVSVADVYDALTSERVYKKAYSHEKAMEMILAGECGTFNPLLLECLKDIAGNIPAEMAKAAEQPTYSKGTYAGKLLESI